MEKPLNLVCPDIKFTEVILTYPIQKTITGSHFIMSLYHMWSMNWRRDLLTILHLVLDFYISYPLSAPKKEVDDDLPNELVQAVDFHESDLP